MVTGKVTQVSSNIFVPLPETEDPEWLAWDTKLHILHDIMDICGIQISSNKNLQR